MGTSCSSFDSGEFNVNVVNDRSSRLEQEVVTKSNIHSVYSDWCNVKENMYRSVPYKKEEIGSNFRRSRHKIPCWNYNLSELWVRLCKTEKSNNHDEREVFKS